MKQIPSVPPLAESGSFLRNLLRFERIDEHNFTASGRPCYGLLGAYRLRGGAVTGLFDAYQIVAILLPGAVLVIGLVWLFPQLRILAERHGLRLGKLNFNILGGVNLGEIGLHAVAGVLAAILAGYLVNAGAGWVVRRIHTLPTQQVLQEDQSLISPRQKEELRTAARAHFRVDIRDKELSATEWFLVTRQMHMRLNRAGRSDRLDTLLRNFGFSRNLTLVLVLLAGATAFRAYQSPRRTRKQKRSRYLLFIAAVVVLLVGGLFYEIMLDYSELYARELILEFIALPPPS